MSYKKIQPYFDADGKRKFADGGVTKGEKKAMFVCECSGKVVWVKSSKTNKNYLANCSLYGDGSAEYESYWYAAMSPHFKTCEQQAKLHDAIRG